jgi:tRNA (guanine37-N1)-methyltransferase
LGYNRLKPNALRFGVITLMPEMFEALRYGVTGRAWKNGLIDITFFNPREYTTDVHRSVDDRPYGGGPGMVMLAEPLFAAIAAAKKHLGSDAKVIYLSPQGRRLDHQEVESFQTQENTILLCGRYEGIDERVMKEIDYELSIGDYVLSGGELAAMVLIDSITRQKPGSLGHSESAKQDSFVAGLLDHPHYTRPADLAGEPVPEILLQGNHAEIERFRLQQALGQTWLKRPSLLETINLTDEAKSLLEKFIAQHGAAKNDLDKGEN